MLSVLFSYSDMFPCEIRKALSVELFTEMYVGPIDKLRGRNCMEDL